MKRSELVNKISNFLRGYQDDGFVDERNDAADALLATIESSGMVPPMIKEKSFTMLPSGELTYAVHEWEPENE